MKETIKAIKSHAGPLAILAVGLSFYFLVTAIFIKESKKSEKEKNEAVKEVCGIDYEQWQKDNK